MKFPRGDKFRLSAVSFRWKQVLQQGAALRAAAASNCIVCVSAGVSSQSLMRADIEFDQRACIFLNGFRDAQVTSAVDDNYHGKKGNLFVAFHIEEGPADAGERPRRARQSRAEHGRRSSRSRVPLRGSRFQKRARREATAIIFLRCITTRDIRRHISRIKCCRGMIQSAFSSSTTSTREHLDRSIEGSADGLSVHAPGNRGAPGENRAWDR